MPDGTVFNDSGHKPITGWYQRLISLASFIRERRLGNFADAALFIECRGGWESTWQMFRKELLDN